MLFRHSLDLASKSSGMVEMEHGLGLVDVHAHLADEAFERDLDAVLRRAEQAGVRAVLAVSETLEEAREILELAERYPIIKPCAGLYPTYLDPKAAEEMVAFLREHADRLAAVGEVGLDYWAVKTLEDRELQRRTLSLQVEAAKELDLTLNVHSRSAGRHAITLLRSLGARRVLLHAFDGKASAAEEGIEAGYYFSIPPSVLRSPQKQKLVRRIPLERLLLESDAPVLGPDPRRRNEPANIRLVCDYIAQIKGIPPEEVARITTENAHILFPKALEA